MSDEIVPNDVPVIRLRKGAVFEEPAGYTPDFREFADGRVIDMNRMYWILKMILEEHPEPQRLKEQAMANPGLNIQPGKYRDEALVAVWLHDEVIGFFEPQLMDV